MAKDRDVYEDAEHLEDEHLENDQDEHENLDDDHDDHDDHEDNDDEDSRVVSSENNSEQDEEREKIRARRREQRRNKKESQKMREHILRSELNARDQLIERLASRIEAIERKDDSSDVARIDAEINSLAQEYVQARDLLARGTEEQDGKVVVAATERMQQIRARADQLNAYKNAAIQKMQQSPVIKQQQIDPRLQNYAQDWLKENKWANPNASDSDNAKLREIDNGLVREGWNPNTAEYWDELTRRASSALPHRFNGDHREGGKQEDRRISRNIVAGSSRSSGNVDSKSSYRLSPERVAAMKEAGLWDDPAKRAKMIAEYKKFDKENGVI